MVNLRANDGSFVPPYAITTGVPTGTLGTVRFQRGLAPKRGVPINATLPTWGEDNRPRSLILSPGDSGESVSYRVSLAFPKLAYKDVSLPLSHGLVSAFGNVDVSSPEEGELDECFTVPVF